MAYRCEQCGRLWDDEAAADNELVCTRRCGGPLRGPLADDAPRKVYVELTTECNLDCAMCIRHAWDRPGEPMSAETFGNLLRQVSDLGRDGLVLNFSGFGEPMTHPRFFDLLADAKDAGLCVEVVTNGTRLGPEAVERFLDLELDRLVVSVDGIRASSSRLLHPVSFPAVAAGLRRLHVRRLARNATRPETGIEFVATRRNVHELPELRRLAGALGFRSLLVTNLIPYTPELADEILYARCGTASRGRADSPSSPCVDLPFLDAHSPASEAVESLRGTGIRLRVNGIDLAGSGPRCRFVTEGRLAVRYDGSVSPCLSLMHSHTYYFRGKARRVRAYHVGNVNDRPLAEIWAGREYRAFRDRVRRFEFSPCIDCGNCDLRETNEEDCTADVFPRCGECLWAAGLVQCP